MASLQGLQAARALCRRLPDELVAVDERLHGEAAKALEGIAIRNVRGGVDIVGALDGIVFERNASGAWANNRMCTCHATTTARK